MLERGEDPKNIDMRIERETAENWDEQIIAIRGIHIATSRTPDEAHREALKVMGLQAA